ncbi:hypothetical protein NE865_07385 [Phthorimaea operculella]|nr:hypothetical protein NE865_07385 [Phthorimaea operculella]
MNENIQNTNMSISFSGDSSIKTSSPNQHEFVNTRQRGEEQSRDPPSKNDWIDFKEDMRRLLTVFAATQKEELAGLKSTLMEVKESNSSIMNSIKFLTDEHSEMKKKIAETETYTRENRDYIFLLEDKLDNMERNTRKANFELKNVPKKTGEKKTDLTQMMTCLAGTLGCDFNENDVKDIYRVRGKTPDETRTSIIVECNSVIKKQEMLRLARVFNKKTSTKLAAKHLGFKTLEDTPVFISEHLTAKASRLYYLARDLKKTKNYRFCWTSLGKVFVRESEQSPIILINSEEQVHQLQLKD